MFNPLTRSEEDGVKAIICLQSIAGVEEPKDKALREWRKMSASDQEYTLRLHRLFKEVDQERKEKKNERPTKSR